MRALPRFARAIQAGPAALWASPEPPEAVTIEVGHGEAMILAAAHGDGKLRLAFGSGEEFAGYCRDLPVKVGDAARNLLDVAAPFVDVLARQAPEPPDGGGNVRITLRTADGVYVEESRVTELREGRSRLAPLWNAFSDLMGPMITVLFGGPSAEGVPSHIPGLSRARSLWVDPPASWERPLASGAARRRPGHRTGTTASS